MKKIVTFVIALLLVPLYSFAQDVSQRINEIGINFHSPTSFGIRFKTGNNKTLLRLTVNSLTGYNNQNKDVSVSTASHSKKFGAGINIGIERRKPISDNFHFYYGSDILVSYDKDSYKPSGGDGGSSSWTISPGLGFVLGLEFSIRSNLIVSAEAVPSIWYSYGKLTSSGYVFNEYTITGLNYGLISPGANITFSYRFGQKKKT
jgi:hypothetical protein